MVITNQTYTFTPPQRSIFAPDNLSKGIVNPHAITINTHTMKTLKKGGKK